MGKDFPKEARISQAINDPVGMGSPPVLPTVMGAKRQCTRMGLGVAGCSRSWQDSQALPSDTSEPWIGLGLFSFSNSEVITGVGGRCMSPRNVCLAVIRYPASSCPLYWGDSVWSGIEAQGVRKTCSGAERVAWPTWSFCSRPVFFFIPCSTRDSSQAQLFYFLF